MTHACIYIQYIYNAYNVLRELYVKVIHFDKSISFSLFLDKSSTNGLADGVRCFTRIFTASLSWTKRAGAPA